MVTGPSGLKTLAEVDQPHVRVVGIANTTTIRAAARSLKNTQPIAATSIDEAVAMLRAGKADAFALSRDSLPDVRQGFSRLAHRRRRLPADRHRHRGAEGQAEALAYVTAFMEGRRRRAWCVARDGSRRDAGAGRSALAGLRPAGSGRYVATLREYRD